MPSRSRSQQRLMQAAEHGATFPMAKKLRATMTHTQLHDFASGSENDKPQHVRPMHPKMLQRAAMVKTSHAHLVKHSPGFSQLPPVHRMRAVQAHITRSLKGR